MRHPILDELATLLAKYNASIDYDCSDTYGISWEAMEITIGRDTVARFDGWSIDVHELKES
jgi:hypothetical protein